MTAAFVAHQHVRSFVADPNYLMANERMNLMNMAKLSIKGLIESALNLGRTLDSDYAPLQQFFVVMEHCLKHGLKGSSGWGAAGWDTGRALQPARQQERLSTVTAVSTLGWAAQGKALNSLQGRLRLAHV